MEVGRSHHLHKLPAFCSVTRYCEICTCSLSPQTVWGSNVPWIPAFRFLLDVELHRSVLTQIGWKHLGNISCAKQKEEEKTTKTLPRRATENKRERKYCCLGSRPVPPLLKKEVQEEHLVPDCAVTDFRLVNSHSATMPLWVVILPWTTDCQTWSGHLYRPPA